MVDGWWHKSACKDVDPELFFPTKGHSKLAKLFCKQCEVRLECLQEGLKLNGIEDTGVWGGLSANQRQKLKGKR